MNAPHPFTKAYYLPEIVRNYRKKYYIRDPALFEENLKPLLFSKGDLTLRQIECLQIIQAELTKARPDKVNCFHWKRLDEYLGTAAPTVESACEVPSAAKSEAPPLSVKKPIRSIRSEVCSIANQLAKSMTRKEAFEAAWGMVAAGMVKTPVAGVTFGKRQEALTRLNQYDPADIRTYLVPEPDNQYDKNAIAVQVGIQNGTGLYTIGYVPRGDTVKVHALIKTGKAKPRIKIIRAEIASAQLLLEF